LVDVGAKIGGRFELLSQAGTGGMSSVYRARDLTSGRTVAVKVLKLDRPYDLVRFGREANTLASVHHPNVVAYVAHGEADGVHFLVQEWVDGITLATQMATLGTTAREGVAIALGVARALEATHALGVVHRDIKPSNVILAGGEVGRVKLVDFGVARLANEAGVLTKSGVLVGTPAYMSPEQAKGSIHIGPAADVWALGCVLFETLGARTPFAGPTPQAIRAKVLLGEPPSLDALCPEAPDELVQLVYDMLTKDIAGRPTDGNATVERLYALPPVPEGPRRVFGEPTLSTDSMVRQRPARGSAPRPAPSAFVMFNALAPISGDGPSDRDAELAKIAQRHRMDLHVFDDGSAVFASYHHGKEAALDAARAALDLQDDIDPGEGAISVFGSEGNNDDTIADAIDRGATLAERAAMSALFGEVVDGQAAAVLVDDLIADLVIDEIPIDRTDEGAVLRGRRKSR
jgi:serine/threonine protein kinase